jgi:hypothetical protein
MTAGVADEAIALGGADEGVVKALGQLGLGKLGEGAREGGLVGDVGAIAPAAEGSQLGVGADLFEELARGLQSVDGFGEEGGGEREPVVGRSAEAVAGCLGGSKRHQGQEFDEWLGARCERAEFGFKRGHKGGLERRRELQPLLARCKPHKGGAEVGVYLATTSYFARPIPSKHFSLRLFSRHFASGPCDPFEDVRFSVELGSSPDPILGGRDLAVQGGLLLLQSQGVSGLERADKD